jgi:hypothetical protein
MSRPAGDADNGTVRAQTHRVPVIVVSEDNCKDVCHQGGEPSQRGGMGSLFVTTQMGCYGRGRGRAPPTWATPQEPDNWIVTNIGRYLARWDDTLRVKDAIPSAGQWTVALDLVTSDSHLTRGG